jgi:hypothetical protein
MRASIEPISDRVLVSVSKHRYARCADDQNPIENISGGQDQHLRAGGQNRQRPCCPPPRWYRFDFAASPQRRVPFRPVRLPTTPWSRRSSRPSRPNSSGAPSSRAGSKPRARSAVRSTASTIPSAAIRRSTSSARFSSKGGQRKIENALHKCRASPLCARRQNRSARPDGTRPPRHQSERSRLPNCKPPPRSSAACR